MLQSLFFCILLVFSSANAVLQVGLGVVDITPAAGTPSAGYAERKGAGMEGVHDPLLAIALSIDNGEKKIILCSVDHLGFTYEMVQAITQLVHHQPGLDGWEIYIGSSHTHSGEGAFLNIPIIGELLAGPYNAAKTVETVRRTAEAIIVAARTGVPAKIGLGYGRAKDLSRYRGLWPKGALPVRDVAILKVTHLDDTPLAVLFNYAVHPTVLPSENRLFSADFVGEAREHLQASLGGQPLYFNGAQGDVIPALTDASFEACEAMGRSLAETVAAIWKRTKTSATFTMETKKISYVFQPQPPPFGLKLPLESYASEMNLLVFNHNHAFITIPGELSCLYDRRFKAMGRKLGYKHVSILGLTNDAHGYIILPEAWRHKTFESQLSFGGEEYGNAIEQRAYTLLKTSDSRKK